MRTDVTLSDAVALLRDALPEPRVERVNLLEAHGRVLAHDLASLCDHPNVDDSALDGYAVRLEDTVNASGDAPVRLRVAGAVAAGASPLERALEPGEAVQVFTGGAVPRGATGIAMVEHTARDGGEVILTRPAVPEIRRAGQDLERGQVYLPRGTVLRADEIALAAAMGHARLDVLERPRIGILSTGDEILEPGEALPPGGVYNSGSYGLAALVYEMGGVPVVLPRVRDDLETLRAVIQNAGDLHVLLTIGGVSMGERDYVRHLLEREGTVTFWRIRMRPGGPPLLGALGKQTIFGLPGNPVSSLVVFRVVVKPALYARWGVLEPAFETVRAVAATGFKSVGAKTGLWRATLEFVDGAYRANAFGNQSSQVLRSLVQSNALAVVPSGLTVNAGDTLEVIRLR
jgi:molybdopterin molybdotransferase